MNMLNGGSRGPAPASGVQRRDDARGIGCSTYPECKYIQRKPRTSTGMPCPKCAEEPCKKCKAKGVEPAELIERVGKRGKFYGCSHYPACRHTQNADPREAKPEEPAVAAG